MNDKPRGEPFNYSDVWTETVQSYNYATGESLGKLFSNILNTNLYTEGANTSTTVQIKKILGLDIVSRLEKGLGFML